MTNIENEWGQKNFKEVWGQTDVVCIDLEETLVTETTNPNYRGLLARYQTLNVETYAAASGQSADEAQLVLDDYRRRFSGRGELVYPEKFGTFGPWFDALSNIDPQQYIGKAPEIGEFLRWIKQQGKLIVLVSNTPTRLAMNILQVVGVDLSVFDQIITWEDPNDLYPKDDDGYRWGQLFAQFPDKQLMTIGDSRFDYEPTVKSGNVGVGIGSTPKGTYSFWFQSVYDIRTIVEGDAYGD